MRAPATWRLRARGGARPPPCTAHAGLRPLRKRSWPEDRWAPCVKRHPAHACQSNAYRSPSTYSHTWPRCFNCTHLLHSFTPNVQKRTQTLQLERVAYGVCSQLGRVAKQIMPAALTRGEIRPGKRPPGRTALRRGARGGGIAGTRPRLPRCPCCSRRCGTGAGSRLPREPDDFSGSRLWKKPDAYSQLRSMPERRCHFAGSESCRAGRACKSCKPAKAASLQGLCLILMLHMCLSTLTTGTVPGRARQGTAGGRTDALLRDLVAGGRRLPRRNEALKCPHLF